MDFIKERHDLAFERITEIGEECGTKDNMPEKLAAAFVKLSSLWKCVCALETQAGICTANSLLDRIKPGNYEESLENPSFAVKKYKRKTGRLLSMMAADPYALMTEAEEGRIETVTLFLELFIEIYCIFRDAYSAGNVPAEAEKAAFSEAKAAYCSFMKDNMELLWEKDIPLLRDERVLRANPQFVYDHREDRAFYLDRSYAARYAECVNNRAEKDGNLEKPSGLHREFPEIAGFTPVFKRECYLFTPAQKKLIEKYSPTENGAVEG